MLNTVGMLDTNKKITPAATMPLGTDSDGPPFDEYWEYASVMGMLMYLSSNYRYDIQFVVNHCSSFTQNSRRIHSEAVMSIYRYLVRTQGKGLTLDPNSDMNMECYANAEFAVLWKQKDDQDTMCTKSGTRYVMTI